MDNFSLVTLCIVLLGLILTSACFSSSETAMMALNKYRLKHLAEKQHRGAKRAQKLLERPDRLIGLILLGNNFVNILAAQIVTVIALYSFGDSSLIISSIILTAVILVFAEVVPKTLAALHPERIAFPSSAVLSILMIPLYPLVWSLNKVSNGILLLFGVDSENQAPNALSREELKTVVKESSSIIPGKHRDMLFGILDLEKGTVEDIMVPRAEINAINLEDDWNEIMAQLMSCRHTRVPCYSGNFEQIEGVLHLRKLSRFLHSADELKVNDIKSLLDEPYYVPLKTDLYVQLLNFQQQRKRIAMVVDEYGEIEGIVTLEDLLEEIIGDFTTDLSILNRDVYPQEDGSFLIDGSANIREINRAFQFGLPELGPKTVNGLILETLEDIPVTGTSFRVGDLTIEIIQTLEKAVKTAKIKRLDLTKGELEEGVGKNEVDL